jgi:hypothetical protein
MYIFLQLIFLPGAGRRIRAARAVTEKLQPKE